MNNQNAFAAGSAAGKVRNHDRDVAFTDYRTAVELEVITPSISASVCFVAGYLGKAYPSHDNRVTDDKPELAEMTWPEQGGTS